MNPAKSTSITDTNCASRRVASRNTRTLGVAFETSAIWCWLIGGELIGGELRALLRVPAPARDCPPLEPKHRCIDRRLYNQPDLVNALSRECTRQIHYAILAVSSM
ncbi:hypothetical protein CAC42_3643 [Sphaceloma murrayae]|uniref:Uncharacterized protein n=1 Tax=Sphaceloma murrayae TaxID=2082308 RepID=A0A2K1QQB8_9PEZI|nr:hypothetical protein CAC42_3643 [Sphaceloma murrayae]